MPPHCDSLDGPVVNAARPALEAQDVEVVLPYVQAEGEDEIRAAFAQAMPVHAMGGQAQEVADRLFFETVVGVHRAGENAAYTGLKPAGLDVGPIIPIAERAARELSSDDLVDALGAELRRQVEHRIEELRGLEARRKDSLEDERRYVSAVLGLQVSSHRLFTQMRASAHCG